MEKLSSNKNVSLSKEVINKVAYNLNDVFKADVKYLPKAKERINELKIIHTSLEKKLLFATSEVPDITRAIVTGEETLSKNEEFFAELTTLEKEVSDLRGRNEVEAIFKGLFSNFKIVQEAEKVKAYQNWISSIKDLSLQLETAIKFGHEALTLTHYEKLRASAEFITKSQCNNLKDYTCQVVFYWHKILLDRQEKEFQSLLKLIKWPFAISKDLMKPPPPSAEVLDKLKNNIRHILHLHVSDGIKMCAQSSLVDKSVEEHVLPSLISGFTVMSVPIQLLLKPLEVRFLYHFSGEKATNSRRNPEWFLTQVLRWIATHENFIDTYIQPILNENDHPRVNCKVEFMKGLLRLVVLKLSSDLSKIEDDEDLFCLAVQETLNFERELRLGLGYPTSQPTVLCVLTQASVFNSWISIEKKFALELMDEFVASPNAWKGEEGGICQCGEQLILLLQGITDRYNTLSQPGHRLQFLDLQLELLDDFRVRVLQLSKTELSDPLQSSYIPILNTVHYLLTTISDWADVPFFIEMHYFQQKFVSVADELLSPHFMFGVPSEKVDQKEKKIEGNSYENPDEVPEILESVFKNILSLYTRIESEMLAYVNRHVMMEIRARSQAFRRDKWFVTPSDSFCLAESAIADVSPSLFPLWECLVKHLLLLRKKLAAHLFSRFWKKLASALNKFIYEEVILQNTFSDYGSAQLNHDVTQALYPVFGEFSSSPENFFPLVKESLILLRLPRPTAFLLRDTLQQTKAGRDSYSPSVSPVKALEEHRVLHLSVHEALTILNIRSNMAML